VALRTRVAVQEEDFDASLLQRELLSADAADGAVATFTGYVRGGAVEAIELEHYPGMTERSIGDILQQAAQRWPIAAASAVHRVGTLRAGEQIVWVGVASPHRAAAFSACEFIMDYLKTRAPLWKREIGPAGARWVDARGADRERAARWQTD
jgi:molybdopterin synthase catalytic subunit